MCPSTGPRFQGRRRPAFTASSSARSPVAKRCRGATALDVARASPLSKLSGWPSRTIAATSCASSINTAHAPCWPLRCAIRCASSSVRCMGCCSITHVARHMVSGVCRPSTTSGRGGFGRCARGRTPALGGDTGTARHGGVAPREAVALDGPKALEGLPTPRVPPFAYVLLLRGEDALRGIAPSLALGEDWRLERPHDGLCAPCRGAGPSRNWTSPCGAASRPVRRGRAVSRGAVISRWVLRA